MVLLLLLLLPPIELLLALMVLFGLVSVGLLRLEISVPDLQQQEALAEFRHHSHPIQLVLLLPPPLPLLHPLKQKRVGCLSEALREVVVLVQGLKLASEEYRNHRFRR